MLPDHVHLLVRLAPKTSIDDCALSLMNNSQHWMETHHKVHSYRQVLIACGSRRLMQREVRQRHHSDGEGLSRKRVKTPRLGGVMIPALPVGGLPDASGVWS